MMDGLKKIPLRYKLAFAGVIAVLAGYGIGKGLGFLPGSCAPAQETLPYAADFQAGGGMEPISFELTPEEEAGYWKMVKRAAACSPYRKALKSQDVNLALLAAMRLEEEGSPGNTRDVILLAQRGPEGEIRPFTIQTESGESLEISFFFYSDVYSDAAGVFLAPPGRGDKNRAGVLLPVGTWMEGTTGYWGFGIEAPDGSMRSPEPGSYLLKIDFAQGVSIYRDPYSGLEYSWDLDSQAPPEGVYQVVSQTGTIPEGWVEVGGVPVSPEFIALQEKIAQSESFTLTPGGLEVEKADRTIKNVESVKIAPDGSVKVIRGERETPILSLEVKDNQVVLTSDYGATYFITQDGQLRQLLSESEAGRLEITPEGEVEIVSEDWGQIRVADAHFDPENGLSVKIGDEEIIVPAAEAPERLELIPVEGGYLYLTDREGKTITAFNPQNPEKGWFDPFANYKIVAPENYFECEVPVEELLNGNYQRWLKERVSRPFDPEKVVLVPFERYRNRIIYNRQMVPRGFTDPETAPFRRDVTAASTIYEKDGIRYSYLILPIEYFDPQNPGQNAWVIAVRSDMGYFSKNNFPLEEEIRARREALEIWWRKSMTTTPLAISDVDIFTETADPLVHWKFERYPDMEQRFESFINGEDMTALSEPGMMFLTYFTNRQSPGQ